MPRKASTRLNGQKTKISIGKPYFLDADIRHPCIRTIMPDNLVTDESAHTRIYNEVTLRYEKIQHFSGPTLNKIATSTWFSQRESGAGGGS